MKPFSELPFYLAGVALFAPGIGIARDPVGVTFNAAVREYCHIVRFPLGWRNPDHIQNELGGTTFLPRIEFSSEDYAFGVTGVNGTTFLVRGVGTTLVRPHYTTNLYKVDFSDPAGVARAASEEEWNSAAKIKLSQKREDDFTAPGLDPKYLERHGLRFLGTGNHLAGAVQSQDQAILVVMGWSGTLGPGAGSDVPGDFSISLKFGNSHGKLFFDFYDADTARKLLAITAKFSGIFPEVAFKKIGWLTERYFVIPLDEHLEQCVVCEFGRRRL